VGDDNGFMVVEGVIVADCVPSEIAVVTVGAALCETALQRFCSETRDDLDL
jgi:hypothetical protein